MADLPFSGLTAATTALMADLICVSQGGVSKKSTRAIFLTALIGESVQLRDAAGAPNVEVDGNGVVSMSCATGAQISLGGNGCLLLINSVGQITITQAAGEFAQLGTGNAIISVNDAASEVDIDAASLINISCNGGAQLITLPAAGPITITFADAGGNFAGGVTDLLVAVTRIATQVKILSGGVPIP